MKVEIREIPQIKGFEVDFIVYDEARDFDFAQATALLVERMRSKLPDLFVKDQMFYSKINGEK